MVKKQLLYRAAAATVLGLSLTTGVVSAQVPQHQHYNNKHHGSNSQQMPTDNSVVLSSVNEQNNVAATNTATQVAQSGDATVTGNWNASDANAKSGNASNSSKLKDATVNVTNSGAGMSADDETPAPSNSSTSSNSVQVSSTNEQNNVQVANNVDQYANTGDAVVAHNGKGGSATSGSATNTSTASFNITVTN